MTDGQVVALLVTVLTVLVLADLYDWTQGGDPWNPT